ncbi:hypothetical protein [Duganella callida]|uniref:Uncharacterized protein n=1 Tax=Duganella callida TaxID=2561932 RepID=A0A4Y9SGI1_9BURK|nr:hypothetical protein [Duganella callida]TFW20490.1 hypothetical protein E4L98_14705 [Duganella callida]
MKVLYALMLVSSAALADDAALLKCRQLDDGPVRLACYNAIPVNPAAPAAAAASTGTGAVPRAAAPGAPAVGYTTVAAPTQDELAAMFGREPDVLKSMRLQSIETTIPGHFDGWVRGQRIRLANGQVWKVVDDTEDVVELVDPKVTVKRGLLGAIFLDIDGAHRNPKVQRVQ